MWEHNGRCMCGRKTYLFAQCNKCLHEDASLLKEITTEEAEAPEPPVEGPSLEVPVPPGPCEPCDSPAAGPVHSDTGPALLPSVLQSPPVKSGASTRHVQFITDRMVHLVAMNKPGAHAGGPSGYEAVLGIWRAGKSYRLPEKPPTNPEYDYRMSFVLESTGDVLPMQHCVDWRFEQDPLLDASHWLLSPAELMKHWEPTAVSDQLDAETKMRPGWDLQ